jgi:hypothetical protein
MCLVDGKKTCILRRRHLIAATVRETTRLELQPWKGIDETLNGGFTIN